MKPEKFTLQVHTLPHVKEFLENRFGSPAELALDSIFYQHLSLLTNRRPSNEVATYLLLTMEKYTTVTEIVVPAVFYTHYGLFISKTNTVKFNQFCNSYIKDVCRMELYHSFILTGKKGAGYEVAREKLFLSSDHFPYDAVKKDFQRLQQRKPHLFSKKVLNSLSHILSRENLENNANH